VVESHDQSHFSFDVNTITGEYFLAWSKDYRRIYGRLFGSHGGKIAAIQSFQGGVIVGQPRYDSHVLVVFDALDNRYFVVWNSRFGDYIHGIVAIEIRGQFVSSNGRAIGTSWVISQKGIYIQKLLYNGKDNQYALFYSIAPDNESPPILYSQRLDAQGRLLGTARKLNSPSGNKTTVADIAYDPQKNRYLVVWGFAGPKSTYIKYRTVSADLLSLGPIHTVEETTSIYPSPIVLYDHYKKRFIILWYREGGLKARGISLNGDPQTNIKSLGNMDLRYDSFTADINASTGSILVGYIKQQTGDPLYLQRINDNLSFLGEPFLGSSQLDARTGGPSVRFSPLVNEFMLIWGYLDRAPNSSDIYGQRVRGTPLDSLYNR
jgi:hypothetical protein